MPMLKLVAAGVIAGVVANVTGYLLTGRLFHRYQAMTPATWRHTESWTQYLYSMVVRIAACIAISFLYAAFAAAPPLFEAGGIARGAGFGGLLWSVTILPVVLETALFVNWHRGFVFGLLLDWLIVCMLASSSAAVILEAAHAH